MTYTIKVDIPEIDDLRNEIDKLKLAVSGLAKNTPTDKVWYTLTDLANMIEMPYSTFRSKPEVWPKNSKREHGGRKVSFHRDDVDRWLKDVAGSLERKRTIYDFPGKEVTNGDLR